MNADDLARDLARAFPSTPGELRRLHDRLAAAAERDAILDVAYRTVDSPVGPLLLAATEAGLVRVAYASEGHDTVLQALADRISPRILNAPARLDAPARELDEYFTGQRRGFDLPLDWRLSAGFRRAVLSHLPEIRYGHTASYTAAANRRRAPGQSARRHRVRDQPAAGRRALPPRHLLRRADRPLPRRPRRQAHPARPGGRRMSHTATETAKAPGTAGTDAPRRGGTGPGRDWTESAAPIRTPTAAA